jgi:hypothetical protein
MVENREQHGEKNNVGQMSRKRFIMVYGVLSWGLLTAIAWSLVTSKLNMAEFLGVLPIALVVFPIGGYFFGAFMWAFTQRMRKKVASDGASKA